ncbi:MAG: GGDEF domain-containing protein [Aquabacterium sp.]|nr:MAG: GGDEF domain-containing protein [Aquabacterium sp.]
MAHSTPTSPAAPPMPAPEEAGELTPEQQHDLRRRGLLELSRRTSAGVFMYAVAWMIVCQGGAFFQQHRRFALANAGGLLAVGILRFALHRRFAVLLERDMRRWVLAYYSLVFCHAVHWGSLLALSVTWGEAAAIRPFMVPMSVAIIMAGIIVVAIDPFLARCYPIAAIAPVVVLLMLNLNAANAVFAALGTAFMAYAWMISRVLRNDYWNGQRARALLENRARELEQVSLTDALTQVPNRLYLDRRLPVEWLQARRHKRPLAVALVDLDHFKRLNDTYGHPFGDRCLREAAATLRAQLLRPSDMVARYGGEEFVVLMPDTDLAGATAVAERLREQVAARSLLHEGQPVRIACSIGVAACMPSSPDGAQRLVKRADEALYQAKADGRNRVVALAHEGT